MIQTCFFHKLGLSLISDIYNTKTVRYRNVFFTDFTSVQNIYFLKLIFALQSVHHLLSWECFSDTQLQLLATCFLTWSSTTAIMFTGHCPLDLFYGNILKTKCSLVSDIGTLKARVTDVLMMVFKEIVYLLLHSLLP